MMIRFLIPLAVTAALTTTVVSSAEQAPPNDKRVLGYGIGYTLGQDVREGLDIDGVVVDAHDIIEGFRAGLHNDEPAIDRDELDRVMVAVHKEMERRAIEHRFETDEAFRALAEANAEASAAFVEQQREIEGTESLPNGVLYRVLGSGNGESPGRDDTVIVNYTITLPDGSLAHSAEQAEVEVADTLEGSRLILQMMQPGDHWEIVLSPDHAFGLPGSPPAIGPNQALLINVELLEIK